MSYCRRIKVKKEKRTNKFSKDNQTATSLSEITEVKEDGKKVTKESHRSTDEIQAQEGIASNVTKLTEDKEICQVTLKQILDELEETVTRYKLIKDKDSKIGAGRISSTEHQDRTISILERYKGLDTFLKDCYKFFFANTKRPIRLDAPLIEKLFNIFYISNEISKPDEKGKASLVLRALKAVRNAPDVQLATTLHKTEVGTNKITADSKNTDGDRAVDVIQKPKHLPQTFSIKDEIKKEDEGSTSHIQEKEESSDDSEFECNDETLMKIRDCMDERKGKTKDGSKMKHKNKMANLSTNRNKPNDISKLDIIDAEALEDIESSKAEADKTNNLIMELKKVEDNKKGNKERGSSRNYIEEAGQFPQNTMEDMNEGKKGTACIDRSNEDIESSKAEADKINDIIMEMKKVEENKKGNKESGSSRNYIEGDGQLPQNTTEDKNKGKMSKACTDRSNEDMQDRHLNKGMLKTKQEVEDSLRKIDKDKTLSLEQAKVLPAGGLNTELDQPKEKVIELEKSCDLQFYLDTDGNKKISSSDTNFPGSVESKDRYNFKYENTEISFYDNHIFVSTQDSEFDIFIRKSDRVNLASEATQTDTLP